MAKNKLIWFSCDCQKDPQRGETIHSKTFSRTGHLAIVIGDKRWDVRKCPTCSK